jgi:hypothetical protein
MNQGISHGMQDTDVLWGYVDSDGLPHVSDAKALGTAAPTPDDMIGGRNDVFNVGGEENAVTKITTLRFSRNLNTGDPGDTTIERGETKPVVFAYNRIGSDGAAYHGPSRGFSSVEFWPSYPPCSVERGDFLVDVEAACVAGGTRKATVTHAEPIETRRCVGGPVLTTHEFRCLYVPSDGGVGITCTVFASLALVVSLLSLAWVLRNWTLPIVKASQPQFLATVCVGGVLLSCAILLFVGTQERWLLDCQLPMWLFHIGFDLMFLPLFLKVNRTYKILNNASRLRSVRISNASLVRKIAVLIAVDVSLITAWQMSSPYLSTDIYEPLPGLGMNVPLAVAVCTGGDSVFFLLVGIYKGLLMVAGCYFAYLALNVSEVFAEAKIVMCCLYLIFCQSLMVLLLTYGTDIAASGKLLIQALATAIGVVTVLLGLLVPKKVKYGQVQTMRELWDIKRSHQEALAKMESRKDTEADQVHPLEPQSAGQYAKVLQHMLDDADEYQLSSDMVHRLTEVRNHMILQVEAPKVDHWSLGTRCTVLRPTCCPYPFLPCLALSFPCPPLFFPCLALFFLALPFSSFPFPSPFPFLAFLCPCSCPCPALISFLPSCVPFPSLYFPFLPFSPLPPPLPLPCPFHDLPFAFLSSIHHYLPSLLSFLLS